jgi:hypothetical protein
MTTDLRAALRDAAGTLNTLARRSESSDRHPLVDPDEFYHAAKQYRASRTRWTETRLTVFDLRRPARLVEVSP